LIVAILLVKVNVGLISAEGAVAELDLALIAGFIIVLLLGPGRLSLDHALGIERTSETVTSSPSTRISRTAV
jgi:putative oxidoreductase